MTETWPSGSGSKANPDGWTRIDLGQIGTTVWSSVCTDPKSARTPVLLTSPPSPPSEAGVDATCSSFTMSAGSGVYHRRAYLNT